jgi:hypothetical protein
MPLEGQWERQHAPLWALGRRERRALAALGALLAVAIAVNAIASLHASSPNRAGCVELTIPSTTGGAAVRACGDQAARLCAGQARVSRELAAALATRCRRVGLP